MRLNSNPYKLLMIPALILAISSVFFEALSYFHSVWMDDGTYSHGYMILVIVAFVLYKQKDELKLTVTGLHAGGGLCLLILLLLAYAANHFKLDFVYRLLFIPAIASTIYGLYPREQAYKFILPLALFSLAVPIWGLTIPALQYIAVSVVGEAVSWSGIEVMVQGIYLSIAAGTFKVANGCSGLRYLLVGGAIALLYSHLFFKERNSWVVMLATSIALGLITNWVRIIYLVYVGHESQMTDPLIADHNMLGWYIFIVPLIFIFWLGRVLEAHEESNKNVLLDHVFTEPLASHKTTAG
ncbi:MAG: exosortase [Paraglaciecola sp.]|jgi:exosortase